MNEWQKRIPLTLDVVFRIPPASIIVRHLANDTSL
jgi:hypothetical protein